MASLSQFTLEVYSPDPDHTGRLLGGTVILSADRRRRILAREVCRLR